MNRFTKAASTLRAASTLLTAVLMSVVLMFVLVGCGGGGGSSGSGTSGSGTSENDQSGSDDGGEGGDAIDSDLNYAQKGPFSPGAEVKAIRLDNDGQRTSDEVTTQTGNNGSFEFPTLPWSGPTLVEVSGTYFNETTGNFSDGEITLQAMMEAEDGSVKGNINLFTHLVAARIKYFQREEGRSFDDALVRALNDFDFWFGGRSNPLLLDLLEAPSDEVLASRSGSLLLFSAAFLKLGFGQAELEAIREEFADDFRDEDAAGYQLYARIGAEVFDSDIDLFEDARDRLIGQYSSNPPGVSRVLSFAWGRNGCEFTADPERLCVGLSQQRFEVGAKESAFLYFDMPSSGSVTIGIGSHRNLDTDESVPRGAAGWTLYRNFDADRSPPHSGEIARCFSGCLDGDGDTSGPLAGDRRYFLRYNPGLDFPASFQVSVSENSDGRVTDPHLLVINEEFEGRVGTFLAGDLTRDTNKSYYRFTAPFATVASQGAVTVAVTGYPCGTGLFASELELRLYKLDELNGGFFNTFSGTPLETRNSGPECDLAISAPVVAGLTYLVRVDNRKAQTGRPSPLSVPYDILVRRD